MYHLQNIDGPQKIIILHNPSYVSPEELKDRKENPEKYPFQGDNIEDDLTALYGDSWRYPTHPQEMPAFAYCGAVILYRPRPAPDYLWESDDYINACSLLDYPQDEICMKCVNHLDQIRDKQGYRPVMKRLRDPDGCNCATWVLMREGCRKKHCGPPAKKEK